MNDNKDPNKTIIFLFKKAAQRKDVLERDPQYKSLLDKYWENGGQDLQHIITLRDKAQQGQIHLNPIHFAKKLADFRRFQKRHPSMISIDMQQIILIAETGSDKLVSSLFEAQKQLILQSPAPTFEPIATQDKLNCLTIDTSDLIEYFIDTWMYDEYRLRQLDLMTTQRAGGVIANDFKCGGVFCIKKWQDDYLDLIKFDRNEKDRSSVTSEKVTSLQLSRAQKQDTAKGDRKILPFKKP